jgi:hypothetical protein
MKPAHEVFIVQQIVSGRFILGTFAVAGDTSAQE